MILRLKVGSQFQCVLGELRLNIDPFNHGSFASDRDTDQVRDD